MTLQVLYKVKTAKIFDKHHKNKSADTVEEDPFAVQHIYLDPESRLLVVAGSTHVILLKYSKQESSQEVPVRKLKCAVYIVREKLGKKNC